MSQDNTEINSQTDQAQKPSENAQDQSKASIIDSPTQEEDLKNPQKKIKSGFMWLGLSSIVSQVLDAVSMLVVMMYITRTDMGVATLAVSIAKCIQAFTALGVGKALVQDNDLTENETHSLFWFSCGFGLVVSLLLFPLAWPAAAFFDNELLVPMLWCGLYSFLTYCIADIPKKLLERRLQYAYCTIVNVIPTIIASILKIVLAIAGAGPWSLVIAISLFGTPNLICALIFSKYRPAMHFSWKECRRFITFGKSYCPSILVETLTQNLHYLVVGKFLGESTLGVYRVAYELATTPALALYNVVNQSSYAIFARLKKKRQELSELFSWNQGNIAIFSAVPIVFIYFCATDMFSLVNDGEWMSATHFLPLALAVSFVKALLQTFPELYRACGKPSFALSSNIVECLLIAVAFFSSLYLCQYLDFSHDNSLITMFIAWLIAFIPLFFYHKHLALNLINTGIIASIKSISKAFAFIAVASAFSIPMLFLQDYLPFQPWTHMVIEIIILLACIGVYVRWIRRKPQP